MMKKIGFSILFRHAPPYFIEKTAASVLKTELKKKKWKLNMNLVKMIEESCGSYSANTAVIYNEKKISYRELLKRINNLSAYLQELGIAKGDKVALMLPNCPEFVISYFAIVRTGAVAVTLNALSTPYELRYLLANSETRAFITAPASAKRFEEVKGELPLCRHLIVTGGPDAPFPFSDADIEDRPVALPEISPDDPAVMIYTSGLTGKPLGAVLTHGNLCSQSLLVGHLYHANEKGRSLAVIPLFHAFGAAVNMLGALKIGAAIVIMDRFTLEGIFSAIEREKITYIAAVPRLFLGMIFQEGAEKYDLSSLDFCITGGSAMPAELIQPFEDKFGAILREGYGLTEASPVCSVVRREKLNKPGSIGTIIPGCEAKVFDDQDRELPGGAIGELVIRGENVMKGYYKDEEATAKVMKEGWLHTGALARIDKDGYIFLAGRLKRMVITSGFNVYPREVEEVIDLHPAVAASRIVSKPDPMRGEIVKALIIRKPGVAVEEKEILRHCRIYLSSYKIPREVEFVEKFGDEI